MHLTLSRPVPGFDLNSTGQAIHQQEMARFSWTQAVIALFSFTFAQETSSPPADGLATTVYGTSTGSIASATVSGATSTYSIPFTGEYYTILIV